MIEKQYAVKIQEHALRAIEELSQILNMGHSYCSQDKFEELKRGIGLSIGEIQMGILEIVNSEFPELDNLK